MRKGTGALYADTEAVIVSFPAPLLAVAFVMPGLRALLCPSKLLRTGEDTSCLGVGLAVVACPSALEDHLASIWAAIVVRLIDGWQ